MYVRGVAVALVCTLALLGGAVPASASGGDLVDDGWTPDETADDGSTVQESTDGGNEESTANSDGDSEASDGDDGSDEVSVDGTADGQATSAHVDGDGTSASVETTLVPLEVTADANESTGSVALDVTARASAPGANDTIANASIDADVAGNATASPAGSRLDAAGTVTADLGENRSGTTTGTELGADATVTLAPNGTRLDGSLAVDADASLDATATTGLEATAAINRTDTGDLRAQRASPAGNESVAGGGTNATGSADGDASGSEATDRRADGATGPDEGPDSSVPAGPAAVVGVGLVGSAVAARSGLQAAGGQSVGGLKTVGEAAVAVDPRTGARAVADWVRIRFPRFFPFGYSRHDDSDPLEHDVRAALYDTIERAPGVHLSALGDETDVSLSTVRHHLRILEAESLVESELIGGKRRYYPAGTSDTALRAALDEEATAAVLHAIATHEPASVSDLADALDRDPSTVSHHLSTLADDDLVVRERDGRAVRTRLPAEVRVAIDGVDAGADVAGDAAAAD